MRREERVTVQGPVKEQQPDGMSHRGEGSHKPYVYMAQPDTPPPPHRAPPAGVTFGSRTSPPPYFGVENCKDKGFGLI